MDWMLKNMIDVKKTLKGKEGYSRLLEGFEAGDIFAAYVEIDGRRYVLFDSHKTMNGMTKEEFEQHTASLVLDLYKHRDLEGKLRS